MGCHASDQEANQAFGPSGLKSFCPFLILKISQVCRIDPIWGLQLWKIGLESFSVSSHHLLSACDTEGIEPGALHLLCHLISLHPMNCSFNLLVSRQTQESAACPRSCIRVWVRVHDSWITQKTCSHFLPYMSYQYVLSRIKLMC